VIDEQSLIYARDLALLSQRQRSYERLLPTPGDLLGSQTTEAVSRYAVALFTDLRGFTGLAERFADDPTTLLSVVNAHLTTVVRAIKRCGGIVEKFVGDGVFATFGARAEMPDCCDRALAAALGVVGANEVLNRRRASEWGFRLEMGVGVAAGKVVVGQLGPPDRCEMGVLGDSVNIAARLVAKAASSEVLLAASAYGGLMGSVRADLIGDTAVRGREGTVEVYRVALARAPVSLLTA
jgi:adenylate cyclase